MRYIYFLIFYFFILSSSFAQLPDYVTTRTDLSFADNYSNPVKILSNDMNGDGKKDLIIAASAYFYISLSNGDGTFINNPGVTDGSNAIAVADFNNDGINDVATAALYPTAFISTYLGTGTGTVGAVNKTTIPTNTEVLDIKAENFNNDLYVDLLVLSKSNLKLYLGNGTGHFTLSQTYTFTGSEMTLGDFNRDGNKDIVIPSSTGFNYYKSNGDGTFAAAVAISSAAGGGACPTSFDINNDGFLDVLFGSRYPQKIIIYKGNGDGTFQTGAAYSSGNQTRSIVAGDFNNDGYGDVVSIYYAGSYESYLHLSSGKSDGSLNTPVPFAAGEDARNGVTGDFNQDGKLDLAVANYEKTVSIIIGNGDNSFGPDINISPGALNVSSYDFDKDGKEDLIYMDKNNGLAFKKGNGDGTFAIPTFTSAPGVNSSGLTLGDFNNDLNQDIVINNTLLSKIYLFAGNGNGTFAAPQSFNTAYPADKIISGDVNNDNKRDIIIEYMNPTTYKQYLDILKGDGTGSLAYYSSIPVNFDLNDIKAADLDVDGNLDFVAVSCTSSTVYMYYGFGNGFYNPYPIGVPGGGDCSYRVTVKDLDIDGIPDIATCNYTTGSVSIIMNKGNRSYSPYVKYITGSYGKGNIYDITAEDVNGDGLPEIVFCSARNSAGVMVNMGMGNFKVPAYFPVGPYPTGVIARDFTGDGLAEIITYNNTSSNHTVLKGPVSSFANISSSTLDIPASVYGSVPVSSFYYLLSHGLTSDVLVQPSNNYEVSLDGINFASSKVITQVNGSISGNIKIFVRLIAGLNSGIPYNGTVSLSSSEFASPKITNVTSTVNKAILTVTFDNKYKMQGQNNPSFTWTYSGFVNGETEAVLDVLPIASCSSNTASTYGIYPITGSGGSDNNYSFIYVNGNLIIQGFSLTPVSIVVPPLPYGTALRDTSYTITGINLSSDININVPSGMQISLDGITFSQSLVVQPTSGSVNVTVYIKPDIIPNVGNYTGSITHSSSDFSNTDLNVQFSVVKAMLTLTVNDMAREEGLSNPTFTAAYSGFKYNEDVTVLDQEPTLTCVADASSTPGSYAIVASGGLDNNYDFTYVDGTLTVNAATGIGQRNKVVNDLNIYPNPVSGEVNVNTSLIIQELILLDVLGNEIQRTPMNNMSMEGLTPGIYILKIISSQQTITKSIIVQ